ncbi:hypothetical protein E2C01_072460 [Portunus trituberculatus]|uniref:Uncharacterized protein n=1 Tax=Portunus trituberculatus TaxID=210409 RepID=A0A5B7HZX9_PORTR|nr:hypothetical protein [Portunus trituberculatus]
MVSDALTWLSLSLSVSTPSIPPSKPSTSDGVATYRYLSCFALIPTHIHSLIQAGEISMLLWERVGGVQTPVLLSIKDPPWSGKDGMTFTCSRCGASHYFASLWLMHNSEESTAGPQTHQEHASITTPRYDAQPHITTPESEDLIILPLPDEYHLRKQVRQKAAETKCGAASKTHNTQN